MKKPGPKPRELKDLRLYAVTVFYTASELADVDQARGHHKRADFIRAASQSIQLAAPLSSAWLTNFSESARSKSNTTRLNDFVHNLNMLNMSEGELAAAESLRSNLAEASNLLDEFRANLSDSKPSRARPNRT